VKNDWAMKNVRHDFTNVTLKMLLKLLNVVVWVRLPSYEAPIHDTIRYQYGKFFKIPNTIRPRYVIKKLNLKLIV